MTMAPCFQVLQTVDGWLGGLGIGVTQADPSSLDLTMMTSWSPGMGFFGTLEGSNNIQPTNIEHIDAHSTAYNIIYINNGRKVNSW